MKPINVPDYIDQRTQSQALFRLYFSGHQIAPPEQTPKLKATAWAARLHCYALGA